MGDDPYEIRTARDAPVPPKLLRFRTQPLHGQTAMQLPDTKTPQQLRTVSSHLAGSAGIAKLRMQGGKAAQHGLLGSRKAEIRRLTPGTWCFVYAVSGSWEEL